MADDDNADILSKLKKSQLIDLLQTSGKLKRPVCRTTFDGGDFNIFRLKNALVFSDLKSHVKEAEKTPILLSWLSESVVNTLRQAFGTKLATTDMEVVVTFLEQQYAVRESKVAILSRLLKLDKAESVASLHGQVTAQMQEFKNTFGELNPHVMVHLLLNMYAEPLLTEAKKIAENLMTAEPVLERNEFIKQFLSKVEAQSNLLPKTVDAFYKKTFRKKKKKFKKVKKIREMELNDNNINIDDFLSSELNKIRLCTIPIHCDTCSDNVLMKLDTGSDVTCINLSTYANLKSPKLLPTNFSASSCTGSSVRVHGYFVAEVAFQKNVKVYVADIQRNLLGGVTVWRYILKLVTDREKELVKLKQKEVFEFQQVEDLTLRQLIIDSFPDLVSAKLNPDGIKHFELDVKLKKNAHPIFVPPRIVHLPYQNKVKKTLSEWEKEEIIRKIDYSPKWKSPLLIVPQDGSIRLFCDFSGSVNKIVKIDKFNVPDISQLLQVSCALLYQTHSL
uniref:Peptidase A2 domain-containing protein n=1 Tax=Strongyloides papillosus TaxID=174720 RepID=A0A0N5BET8_STREA